jgi:hypothetical protein
MVGNKAEFNVGYIFRYKHLFSKLNYGCTPGSNFGTVAKYFLTIGYTSNIDKTVSWHILGGGGLVGGNKVYSVNGRDLYFGTLTPLIEGGLAVIPFKNKDILIGLDGTCFKTRIFYFIDPTYSHTADYGYNASIHLNIIFKLL